MLAEKYSVTRLGEYSPFGLLLTVISAQQLTEIGCLDKHIGAAKSVNDIKYIFGHFRQSCQTFD